MTLGIGDADLWVPDVVGEFVFVISSPPAFDWVGLLEILIQL